MQASETCLTAIKGWESCRFAIYDDQNGFPTIGWGHKLTPAEIASATYAEGITQEQADSLFLADIVPTQAQVDSLGHWTQGQMDALTSFNFNLGIDRTQTMLSHGIAQVPVQIPRWIYVGGKIAPGLVTRRAQEVAWWNS